MSTDAERPVSTDAGGEIRRLRSRVVYRTNWMTIREDEVEFPDGERGTYSVVDKTDFVVLLPYEDGGFWLVQQYRYAVERREWEFPQGGWPAGRTGTAEELARAELREETGLRPAALEHLGRPFASYGYCSQAYDVFLATGLTRGETAREQSESDMIARWHSTAEVLAMIRDGRLADAHSLAAFTLYQLHLGSV